MFPFKTLQLSSTIIACRRNSPPLAQPHGSSELHVVDSALYRITGFMCVLGNTSCLLRLQVAEISRVLRPGGVFVASTFLKASAPLGQLLQNDDIVRPLNAVSQHNWFI